MDGKWWRASEYRIFELGRDSLIGPAEDAGVVPYDPWEPYRKFELKTRSDKVLMPPYLSLVELGQRVREIDSQRGDPKRTNGNRRDAKLARLEAKRSASASFVAEWGLLGILSTFATSINFPGRILEERAHVLLKGLNGNVDNTREQIVIEQLSYLRLGGQWFETSVNHLVDLGKENKSMPSPGVSRVDLSFSSTSHESLESLNCFMPAILPNHMFPIPNSPDFFCLYAEPISDICLLAEKFLDAVLWLSKDLKDLKDLKGPKGSRDSKGWKDWAQKLGLQQSAYFLSALAQCAAPSFVTSPEGFYLEEVRTSASLISSFALMFLWDRAAGRRVLRCKVCKSFFVSDDKRAEYCCRSHRLTASSRRARAKKASRKKE